jgi:putative endonuclease
MHKGGTVYIMANKLRTVIYVGVTSDLRNRVWEHKSHFYKGSFTDKHNCTICVYYCHYSTITEAITFEKQIKKWSRKKKDELITVMNPSWEDLWREIETW